jgi:hypothetical protein
MSIRFSFSGGTSNVDPNKSIGGDRSTRDFPNNSDVFTSEINDLFDNSIVYSHADYRCLFLTNESSNLLSNVEVVVSAPLETEPIKVGVQRKIEKEFVVIPKPVTGGYLIFGWEEQTFGFDSYPTYHNTWAAIFQLSMRSINGLEDVVVVSLSTETEYVFEITFNNDYRKQTPLTVVENGLNEYPDIDITIENDDGSPINSTPYLLPVGTVSPIGVDFELSTTLGTLYPNDSVPIWIQRDVATQPINGSFTLSVVGQSLGG